MFYHERACELSVTSGACRNPPGHPSAAGPHQHGKPRRGGAFRYRDSPSPPNQSAKRVSSGRERIPSGHPHLS